MKRRQVILVSVLLLATLFLATQFSRLEEYLGILATGHPGWIGLSVLALAGWQVSQAALFRAAQRAVAVEQSLLTVLPVVAANNFILLAVPAGSLSTLALFLANARRRGASPERTAVAVAGFAVFQYLTLALAIALGLLALAARGALHPLEWVPAVPIFAIALGQYAALLLAMHFPARVARATAGLAERLNRLSRRLLRRDLVAGNGDQPIGATAADGLHSMRQNGPRAQLRLLLYGLLSQVLLGLVLATVLRAFGQPVAPSTVLAGLGMAGLYSVVSPTPIGVGVVEGAVAVVLASLGLGAGPAVIVSLAFRGLTLWLPVLYGFLALQALGFRTIRPDGKQ